ncbi:MAG TPA: NAD(P)-dependent methylenetetrahydromethanopterin dehydrogenase [Isosphaeraceae bacterium]|nr:NAD(P)-dependent methylenetetrahydromethanopterin dehydrogenase [Isosphaeraceae bacterium]
MKPTILIQLDADTQPSVFDGVVAVDAGVEHLFRHGGIVPGQVRDLVFGALFTRGGDDLKRTAIFVGGSDVAAAEAVFRAVKATFFGEFRVSALLDANGCNTTAAAAALAVIEDAKQRSGSFEGTRVAVLGATGPVGQRVARLLAGRGGNIAVGSRKLDRAVATAEAIRDATGRAVRPFATPDETAPARELADAELIVSAGAVGVTLLPAAVRKGLKDLRAVVDLNAVPPLGVEGIKPTDKGTERDGVRAWGALGVGGTKMKIHKKAIQELFTSNTKVLDAEEVLALGEGLA